MDFVRAFIAVDLSIEVQRGLEGVLGQLQPALHGAPVRWVPPRNMHLTLKFLGDVSPKNLEMIKGILAAEAENHSPFEIQVGELGAFPSIRRPRVVWIGVQAPPALEKLQHEIDLQTARLGYPQEERKFTPHLTLGRVGRNASPKDADKIAEVLSATPVGLLGSTRIREVYLYRSDLNPQGAVYTRLFTALLKPSTTN
jgi:2'-5' RNA ligase